MGIAALDRLNSMEQTASASKMFRNVDGEIELVEVKQDEEYAVCSDADSKLTLQLNGVSEPFTIRSKDSKTGVEKDSECFRIELKIVGPSDSPYVGKCVDAMTDCKIGPGNRTRRYIEAFLGRPLGPGEKFSWTDALLSKNPPKIKAFLSTTSKTSKQGTTYEVNVIGDNALQHVPAKSAPKPKDNPFDEDED